MLCELYFNLILKKQKTKQNKRLVQETCSRLSALPPDIIAFGRSGSLKKQNINSEG